MTPQALVDQGLGDDVLVAPTGGLILWDLDTGRGVVLEVEGGRTEVAEEFRGPYSPRLAISQEGALAFPIDGGRSIEVRRADGTRRELQIGYPVGGLVWLDEQTLALSPMNGDYLVELWDTGSGKRLRGIEEVSRISEAPGYRLLRGTELEWDAEHRRLHALDAFTGRYRVYKVPKLLGAASEPVPIKRVAEGRIDDRNRELWNRRLETLDRTLTERGEFQGASIWRFAPALDSQGVVWMVERCDEPEGAHLLAVDSDGTEHRFQVSTPCCAATAVPWGEHLVFARSARTDLSGCFAKVSRPSLDQPSTSAFWMEATPLSPEERAQAGRAGEPSKVLDRFAAGTDPGVALDHLSSLAAGLTLVCLGGPERPITCDQIWLDPERPQDVRLFDVLPGRSVTGRVTVEGVGVGGASVGLVPEVFKTTRRLTLPLAFPAGAREPVRRVETDREGRFVLPELGPGGYRLLLELPGGRTDHTITFTVRAPRRSGAAAGAANGSALDLGELDFPAGLTMEVLITDLDGEPLPEAVAGAAQDPVGQERSAEAVTLFQASAGEDGRAVIDGLAGDRGARVSCQAAGFGGWSSTFDAPPSFVDCSLAPLARVSGRVVTDDGEAPKTGRVTLRGGSAQYGPLTETVRLDREADGRFSFENLEPARVQLVASSPGRGSKALSLTLEPGDTRDLGELVLDPGATWRVRVVERVEGRQREVSEPVPGATITAVSPPESIASSATDAWGEAEVEGPATGPLTVEVQAPEFAPRRLEIPESARTLSAEPYEIVLGRGGWIEAHAWDEESGEPCAGCRITLDGAGPSGALVTDASGVARSEPLAAGGWSASLTRLQGYGVMVTRSGGHDVRRVTVKPGQTTEVYFGEPNDTLDVVLSPAPPEAGGWRLVVLEVGGASKLYRLDHSGSASVRTPRGGALLSLTDGRVTIELDAIPEDASDPVVVDLPFGLLVGRLPDDLDVDPGPSGLLRLELLDLSSGRRVAEAEAVAGAEIRVPFLPAGLYELRGGGVSLGVARVIEGREAALELSD